MSLESILQKYPRPAPASPTEKPPSPPTNPAKDARQARNHQLALHHANLIQERKDIEDENFTALEELIDFPSSTVDAHAPAPADIARFKILIRYFQQSDYDSLIEERHMAEKCGYVFCPRPHKSTTIKHGQRQLKLVWNKHEMKSVPMEKVDVWCSMDCKRMAMHIKVQLSEIPAWDRAGGSTEQLAVMGSVALEPSFDMPKAMAELSLKNECGFEAEEELGTAMADLAAERGDTLWSHKASAVSKSQIRERKDIKPPEFPNPISSAMEIEGYNPRMQNLVQQSREQHKNDDEAQDWEID